MTLKDDGGAVLVDLVVGKEVSGSTSADLRYVRDASSDSVYSAKVSLDISTAFRDWVIEEARATRPPVPAAKPARSRIRRKAPSSVPR